MKKLEIITRPDKLETLKEILDARNCTGMTISSVMGCGQQRGNVNEIKGMKFNINLIPKIQVNVVVLDEMVETLLIDIREKIATGHVGDGKVFISEIQDAMRIRTGERGSKVI
jgi:nitrogen regulatory protein P-II 1